MRRIGSDDVCRQAATGRFVSKDHRSVWVSKLQKYFNFTSEILKFTSEILKLTSEISKNALKLFRKAPNRSDNGLYPSVDRQSRLEESRTNFGSNTGVYFRNTSNLLEILRKYSHSLQKYSALEEN